MTDCWMLVALAPVVPRGSMIAAAAAAVRYSCVAATAAASRTTCPAGPALALIGRAPRRIAALEIAPVLVPVRRRAGNYRVRRGACQCIIFVISAAKPQRAGSGERAVDNAQGP